MSSQTFTSPNQPHPPSEPNTRPRPPPRQISDTNQISPGGPARKNRHYRVIGSKRQLTHAVVSLERASDKPPIQNIQVTKPQRPVARVLSTHNSAATLSASKQYHSAYRTKLLTQKKPMQVPRPSNMRTRNFADTAHNSANMVCSTTRAAPSKISAKVEPGEFPTASILTLANENSFPGGKTPRRIINGKASVPYIRFYKDNKSQTVDARLAPKFVVDPSSLLLVGGGGSTKKLPTNIGFINSNAIEERRKSIEAIIPFNNLDVSPTSNTAENNVLFQKVIQPQPAQNPRLLNYDVPLPASQVLIKYSQYLNDFEKGEILDYREVFYFGEKACQQGDKVCEDPSKNNGFDDAEGYYNYKTHGHMAYRYEIIELLGKGSFGQVFKCKDHKTGNFVALKVIKNKKRFHQQAIVEVRVLDAIRKIGKEGTAYVVEMLDYFSFRNHICLSFELLSITLYDFMRMNSFSGFSLSLIRKFAIQILLGMCLMQKLKIVHCDLKPENILLKHPTRSGIKIIDLGSGCFENEKIYTYIQSRFYRAPEIVFGIPYTCSIDVWSFGCILFELYTGNPLFPGESEGELLQLIMEVKGLPSKELIMRGMRWKMFFDDELKPKPPNAKVKMRRPGSKDLRAMLNCKDKAFVDLIERCLEWDPLKRISPEDALNHQWILDGIQSLMGDEKVEGPILKFPKSFLPPILTAEDAY